LVQNPPDLFAEVDLFWTVVKLVIIKNGIFKINDHHEIVLK